MSHRMRLEDARLRDRVENGDPYWPAQLSVAVAIALDLVLAERVSVGPRWVLPVIEAVALAALIVVLPSRATKHDAARRGLTTAVIGFVSLANVADLGLLVHYLINGGKAGGHALVLSGAALWGTNVLLFAVWYWDIDRGGPVHRFHGSTHYDFQFPQMENPKFAQADWRPGFFDYFYVSLTNATAFSPTDTMPLTQTAKLVMGVQSVSALLTVGLVIARAVNILG